MNGALGNGAQMSTKLTSKDCISTNNQVEKGQTFQLN